MAKRQQFNYRWVDFRNCYEVYHIQSGAHVAYYDNVDDARARTDKLNNRIWK